MTAPNPTARIGSLFSGYGGLELGIQAVLDADTAWHVEFDAAPSRILAHHWPDIPNHGDITTIDWATVEPVDILCGGFPCQDVSLAGLRRGLKPDTRSGLWSHFAQAIDALRPELVIIENVRGLLSAQAHSDLEPDPWNLGEPTRIDRPALRALGAVLGDLADLGYDTDWQGVRAADAGAPHGRFRIFIVARPTADPAHVLEHGTGGARDRGTESADRSAVAVAAHGYGSAGGLDAVSAEGRSDQVLRELRDAVGAQALREAARGPHTLPQPQELRPGMREQQAGGDQGRQPLAGTPLPGGLLFPVRFDDSTARPSHRPGSSEQRPGEPADPLRFLSSEAALAAGPGQAPCGCSAWGQYAPAIHRWELVLERSAPTPTEPGPKGASRLSARAVEFMMGLPAGHVTDPAIGLTRNEQLKALGNGVVPQQAALALTRLLTRQEATA